MGSKNAKEFINIICIEDIDNRRNQFSTAVELAEEEMRQRAISSFDELVKWIYEHYSIHKELGDKELKAKFIELLDKTE